MGYSMEFYSLSLQALRRELLTTDSDTATRAYHAEFKPAYSSNLKDPANSWILGASELSLSLGKATAANVDDARLSDEANLVLISMIRYLGFDAGSIDHASASGKDFLERFLDEVVAQQCFQHAFSSESLLSRPLYGLLAPELLPSWGWLTRSELHHAMTHYQAPSKHLEGDMSVWLEELVPMLHEVEQRGSDLVTIYG